MILFSWVVPDLDAVATAVFGGGAEVPTVDCMWRVGAMRGRAPVP